MTTKGVMVVMPEMAVNGIIRNCLAIEVLGRIDGEISARSVVIREGGLVSGKIKADSAEVHGTLVGNAFVRGLMRIGQSGSVTGKVRYGQLAMEPGAQLAADVRNLPPEVLGDLELTVDRGAVAKVTVADLTAVDPDDTADALTYTVSRVAGGFVELASAPSRPAATFTQADLEAGTVSFRHDGGGDRLASFDVTVTDRGGATSGVPRTVQVLVR